MRPMFRPRTLVFLAAVCAGVTIACAAPGAGAGGFSVGVSTPALIKNAVVTERISCPASQSKCSGATLAYVPAEPQSLVPALRSGLLIAPAAPFSLKRGQATTLRMLIPLSEVDAFRQARHLSIQTYTLAANPNTKQTASVFRTGIVSITSHDRRLYNLNRLRLRLVKLQLKRQQNRLNLTVDCTGASAKAKASVYGGCEGLIDVFGGTLSATPPRTLLVGGTAYFLKANTTFRASIKLLKGRLAQVAKEAKPYLAVYSIASDRVDLLAAAQLVKLRFHQVTR